MSSYIYFYTRVKDSFHLIGTFCRSSEVYQFGSRHDAPYGKLKPLKIDTLEFIIEELNEQINNYKTSVNKVYQEIDFIKNCTSPLEEKVETYEECMSTIDEYNELIDDVEFAKNYYNMLILIIDNIQYNERYDENSYIYFGIEIPEDITKEDIIE